MPGIRQFQFYSFLFLFGIIFGCAPVIYPDLRAKTDPSLTFENVLQNPNIYKDKTVIWGGEIIQVLPQDGTTIIEVRQKPLGRREKPKKTPASKGKFMVLFKEFVDLSQFSKGKKITVAGKIQGEIEREKIALASDKNYRYPIILSEQIHLWREYRFSAPYDPRQDPDYERGGGILRRR